MDIKELKYAMLYRVGIKEHWLPFSESVTSTLLSIFIMNENYERCSCYTLRKFMASIYHTPNNKNLRKMIRLLKREELIRSFGKGSGTNMILSQLGKQHLNDVNDKLRYAVRRLSK